MKFSQRQNNRARTSRRKNPPKERHPNEGEDNLKSRSATPTFNRKRTRCATSSATKKEQDRVKSKERYIDKEQEKVQQRLDASKTRAKTWTKSQYVELLEKISNMSAGEAQEALKEQLLTDASHRRHPGSRHLGRRQAKGQPRSQKNRHPDDPTRRHRAQRRELVSVFNIKNDDVKGRIIGREGRNIRALEASTGVEFIVDDTPEAIILSCFDPVRREIARLSLHQLVTDGRIHPARIEEVVAKVTKKLEEEILEIGKRTCIDLGIHNMKGELTRMVGRMKYRSSYGQNLLQHSREVANLWPPWPPSWDSILLPLRRSSTTSERSAMRKASCRTRCSA